MRLSSIGQNPCGPLAGNRDRDRRPCEGFSNANAARPVASARTASRQYRDAVARLPHPCGTDFSLCPLVCHACVGFEEPQAKARATVCAIVRPQSAALSNAYAMIFLRLGRRADFPFVSHASRRSNPMMVSDRSTRSRQAMLFLLVLLGIPSSARAASLED